MDQGRQAGGSDQAPFLAPLLRQRGATHARVVAGDITLIAALRLKRRDDVRIAALPAGKF
jgi:hypothetical protein